MKNRLYHLRREVLGSVMSGGLSAYSQIAGKFIQDGVVDTGRHYSIPENPASAEDFRPLENACFQDPYAFYKYLRDHNPVYRLSNGVYCISRYQDIVDASKDVETFSSACQGLVANLPPGQDLIKAIKYYEYLTDLGLIPADVLATSDPPQHTSERKVGHTSLNARFVKSLEGEVEELCREMMDRFMEEGRVEFMQEFGWRLPMVLIIRLLGLPEEDFEQIKEWCVIILNSQNGVQNHAELMGSHSAALKFLDYCWEHYLQAKRSPGDNLMGVFARAAADRDNPFDDKKAASAIFQLLIAGSDSSATTMGNALKMLIDNPGLQEEMREDHGKIPAFIEEVFRLESAFQGHFRWTKKDTEMHGVKLPRGSRIFLMWASGNRDERFWEDPDSICLNRKNGKKHLTFGHGIHACLGRELARMEIRIVLREFLTRTSNLEIAGDTPYVASMFARTLLQLPVRFDPVETGLPDLVAVEG